ncbi:MAG TPA: GIY-YIG nuclease family protein [Oceanospirillales bacterium]|nr:GIY-YIG nuclease family protein [Oceanospirillales bacterium]
MKHPVVYILSNKHNNVLYVGVTSNLPKRIWEHKEKVIDGYSKKYNLEKLVYFETHISMQDAIVREKQLKKWNRDWKIRLIEEQNPGWIDMYANIL